MNGILLVTGILALLLCTGCSTHRGTGSGVEGMVEPRDLGGLVEITFPETAAPPVFAEPALTPAEKRQGLMFRTRLEEGEGMLFVYDTPQPLNFWMKNMEIPLDILFADGKKEIIRIHEKVAPCLDDPCELYSSGEPAQYVLELPSGFAEKYTLFPGQRLEFE